MFCAASDFLRAILGIRNKHPFRLCCRDVVRVLPFAVVGPSSLS